MKNNVVKKNVLVIYLLNIAHVAAIVIRLWLSLLFLLR